MSDARTPYLACPLCDCAEIRKVSDEPCSWHALYKPPLPPVIHWVQCEACLHIFTDGYFTDAALEILFTNTQEVQKPGQDPEGSRVRSAEVVELVEAFRGYRQGRWLDVGFGDGSLLTTALEYGWEVVGLDLRPSTVQEVQAIGIEAHIMDIVDFEPSQAFDVISLADVLEHMPFPKPALLHARELLAPDGHLFLSMPNADSYVWWEATMRLMNPYWGEIEHYHNFGKSRLYDLLAECGFTPLRYTMNQRYRMGMQVLAAKAVS